MCTYNESKNKKKEKEIYSKICGVSCVLSKSSNQYFVRLFAHLYF